MSDVPKEKKPHPSPLLVRALELRCLSEPEHRLVTTAPRIRVGKSQDNDFVLQDPTVSRRHLEIRATPHGMVVRDLDSTNGTALDGRLIREAHLKDGSVLTVGNMELEVRLTWQTPPVAPLREFRGLTREDPAGQRLLGACAAALELGLPVALWGEAGSGRTTLATALLGRPPDLVVDPFEDEDPAERIDEIQEAPGTRLLVREPWALPRAAAANLGRRLTSSGQMDPREGCQVVTVWSFPPPRVLEAACGEHALLEYLTSQVIWVPPARIQPRALALALDRTFRSMAEESSLQPPRWVRNLLEALPWRGNWPDVHALLQWFARFGLLNAPLEEVLPLDGMPRFQDWKKRWDLVGDALYVQHVMAATHGNVSAAARLARMDRKHLTEKVRRLGLKAMGRKTSRRRNTPSGQADTRDETPDETSEVCP